MDCFSKKYQKWYRCLESNRHDRSLTLYKFGDYWYERNKDLLVHNSFVDDYIDNCRKGQKKHKKDAYCKKNNIEIK